MVATLEFSRQLHTGIVLTATGVSRCVEIEGYAVLTPLPVISQIGVGIAFDVPVVAEACGLGSPGLSEEVEIRVYGRGLSFSNPALPRLLEDVATKAYANNGEVDFQTVIEVSKPLAGIETVVASLEGSNIVVHNMPIPLYDLGGVWGVIVKLNKPLNSHKIIENIFTRVGVYEKILLDHIDNIIDGLYLIYQRLGQETMMTRLNKVIGYNEKLEALGLVIDISGKQVAYLFSDYDDALEASLRLESEGAVLEAPLTVLGM